MAATFVVETGTGSASANAYTTEAEVDQYLENYGDPAAWSALGSAAKQAAIREATRYIDARYRGAWKGTATFSVQRLAWPRTDVEHREGFFFDPSEMPTELKDACAALSLEHVNSTAGLLPGLASGGGPLKSKAAGVGALKSAKEFFGPSREAPEFPMVDGILGTLLIGSGAVGVLRRG